MYEDSLENLILLTDKYLYLLRYLMIENVHLNIQKSILC